MKILTAILERTSCRYYSLQGQRTTYVLCEDFIAVLLGYLPKRMKVEVSTSPLKGGFSAYWDDDKGELIPSERIQDKIRSQYEYCISYCLMSDAQYIIEDILKPGGRIYIRITDVSKGNKKGKKE